MARAGYVGTECSSQVVMRKVLSAKATRRRFRASVEWNFLDGTVVDGCPRQVSRRMRCGITC